MPRSLDPTMRPPARKDGAHQSGSQIRRPHSEGDPWERRDNTLLVEGVRVGKKFDLIRGLGYGGMGKVWLCRHVGLDRRVALKVLHRAVHDVEHHRERFEKEARAIGSLRHPGIVEALDFGELEDGRNFLAMEYVEGATLADVLKKQECLPWRVAVRIGGEVADALAFAHAHGVIHRDLKPDNLIVEGGDPLAGHVRLFDLGLADVEGSSERGFSMGTAGYSAPEQLRGEPTDARADVYGLGAVLYHLIAGRPAHTGNELEAVAAGRAAIVPLATARPDSTRPPAVDALIERMLAADATDRPATIDEIRAGLRTMAVSLPPPPLPSVPVLPPARRVTLRRLGWLAIGIAVGVIVHLLLTRLL